MIRLTSLEMYKSNFNINENIKFERYTSQKNIDPNHLKKLALQDQRDENGKINLREEFDAGDH